MIFRKKEPGKGGLQILFQTVSWLVTKYFSLRGRQEHQTMTVKDFWPVPAVHKAQPFWAGD